MGIIHVADSVPDTTANTSTFTVLVPEAGTVTDTGFALVVPTK